jgi:hypothetical protein
LGRRLGLRRIPYYVARIACDLGDPGDLGRVRFLSRGMLEAVKLAGLQLRLFVEACRACPFCGLVVGRGGSPFHGKLGLYIHMLRKHYSDLLDLALSYHRPARSSPRKFTGVE